MSEKKIEMLEAENTRLREVAHSSRYKARAWVRKVRLLNSVIKLQLEFIESAASNCDDRAVRFEAQHVHLNTIKILNGEKE